MARIELAPEFGEDMDRIADHLLQHEVIEIEPRLHGIVAAIQVLRANPLIGRPKDRELRELVIGRGSRGYVALYRYVATVDTVFVLAIRAQREGGVRKLMNETEADTRANRIDPVLRAAGWGVVEGSRVHRELICPGCHRRPASRFK